MLIRLLKELLRRPALSSAVGRSPVKDDGLDIESLLREGYACHEHGDMATVEVNCRKILKFDERQPDAWHLLGLNALKTGKNALAVEYLSKAIAANPANPFFYNNCGEAHRLMGEAGVAMGLYQKAIDIKPDYAEAYHNLANAQYAMGNSLEAIELYHKAIGIKQDYAEVYSNLGVALSSLGRINEAIESYDKAINLRPDFAQAHSALSMALLQSGDFVRGWREYEWRRFSKGLRVKDLSVHKLYRQPLWRGEGIAGKTILLHAEQGYGDTIQFIRYAPLLADRGAKVIVNSHKELVPVLQSIRGISRILERGQPPPDFDVHSPILSLPLAFGTTLHTIPAQVPYIRPNPELMEKWRCRLLADAGQVRIGLVWAGNPRHPADPYRSLKLEDLAPLGRIADAVFYSLQKGETAKQSRQPPPGMKLCDVSGDLNDFGDTAGLIGNLDLVISVDTSVVHLAGAMGKPVWNLLAYSSDWRWLLERRDSPWYPTMRLFRQQRANDWEPVIAAVGVELARLRQA